MSNLWDRRYRIEGPIWGDEPSFTAHLLLKQIAPQSQIIDLGYGYGRDLKALIALGHTVTGFELSIEALRQTAKSLMQAGLDERKILWLGRFNKAQLQSNFYDGLISHRSLHLIDDGVVEAIAIKAHQVLKPGAVLCVSARDPRDFDKRRMRMIEPGVAEYTEEDRSGHIIRFWDENRFEQVFNDGFEILDFVQGSELESSSDSDTHAYFTIMRARRR